MKADTGCLRMALGVREEQEEISQVLQEAVEMDGYVHYLDCGDSFSGVYVCQNLSNYTA